jgi:hypothetical protein
MDYQITYWVMTLMVEVRNATLYTIGNNHKQRYVDHHYDHVTDVGGTSPLEGGPFVTRYCKSSG